MLILSFLLIKDEGQYLLSRYGIYCILPFQNIGQFSYGISDKTSIFKLEITFWNSVVLISYSTIHQFKTLTSNLIFSELRKVSVEHVRRAGHSSRARVSVSLKGSCICYDCWDKVLAKLVVIFRTFHFVDPTVLPQFTLLLFVLRALNVIFSYFHTLFGITSPFVRPKCGWQSSFLALSTTISILSIIKPFLPS